MRVEIPAPQGGKVISIELLRQNRIKRDCEHLSIIVDSDLAEVECSDCHKFLSPVDWIERMAEEWSRIEWLYKVNEKAAELYAQKSRTKCDHCGQMTRVNPPEHFDKNLREVRGF